MPMDLSYAMNMPKKIENGEILAEGYVLYNKTAKRISSLPIGMRMNGSVIESGIILHEKSEAEMLMNSTENPKEYEILKVNIVADISSIKEEKSEESNQSS